jgi:4-hydroxyphenylacetate 3-monooxygenase
MITPSEADLEGPLAPDIGGISRPTTARPTTVCACSGWPPTWPISSFGNRQVLYERFFASDPLSRVRALAALCPKSETKERVFAFLRRDDF